MAFNLREFIPFVPVTLEAPVSESIPHLSANDFEASVLKSELPVLVDFWAEWCEPCKRMNPVLEELATELAGRMKIAKVNVEAHPAIANQFRVRGLPTFMVFKNGQVQGTQIGAVSKSQLAQFVNKAM